MKKALAAIILIAVSGSAFGARVAKYVLDWRGTVSSDWDTAANWSNNIVPPVYDTAGVMSPGTIRQSPF